jgi:hypothetical protein
MTTATDTRIEWRVTCHGINPRYFDGTNARYHAWQYAQRRPHLHPTTWWRHRHPNDSTGPWINLANTDPRTVTP